MRSANTVVNVNDKEFYLHDHDSFVDMMESIGLSEEEVLEFAMTDEVREAADFGQNHKNRDGVYGDDFYNLVDEMWAMFHAFQAAANCLRDPSRKGNTRADIADYIEETCSNFKTIIP